MKRKFDILISSTGRVGSTMLMDFVSDYMSTNPNHFSLRRNPDGEYKHIIVPPKEKVANKAIFMYGNIYNIIISIYKKNRLPRINFTNRRIPIPPEFRNKTYSLEQYLDMGKDWFYYQDQLSNWKNEKTPYPKMLIKYESMYDHLEEIFDFCKIDRNEIKKFPPYRPRESDFDNHPCKDALKKVYGSIQKYIDSQPDIEILP